MRNYRILKGESAQREVLAVGNEAVFKTFNLTIPEKKPETRKAATETEETPAERLIPAITPEDALMQKTIERTDALMEAARAEAEEIRQRAYDEGFAKGAEEGREAGRQQAWEEQQDMVQQKLRELQEEIAQYVTDMETQKDKVLEEYLDDLKNIALAIGEKIVQTSLKSSSEVVKKMILAATEKLKKTAWAKIYVADSGDEMEIQGDAQLLQELTKLSDNVKIIIMEDAEPGTCIIELPHEVIDISTSTQMENIRDILNNARA